MKFHYYLSEINSFNSVLQCVCLNLDAQQFSYDFIWNCFCRWNGAKSVNRQRRKSLNINFLFFDLLF